MEGWIVGWLYGFYSLIIIIILTSKCKSPEQKQNDLMDGWMEG